MTAALFREWVRDIPVPKLKIYRLKENLDFKILIVLDNEPCHPLDLDLIRKLTFKQHSNNMETV